MAQPYRGRCVAVTFFYCCCCCCCCCCGRFPGGSNTTRGPRGSTARRAAPTRTRPVTSGPSRAPSSPLPSPISSTSSPGNFVSSVSNVSILKPKRKKPRLGTDHVHQAGPWGRARRFFKNTRIESGWARGCCGNLTGREGVVG